MLAFLSWCLQQPFHVSKRPACRSQTKDQRENKEAVKEQEKEKEREETGKEETTPASQPGWLRMTRLDMLKAEHEKKAAAKAREAELEKVATQAKEAELATKEAGTSAAPNLHR